MALKVSELVKSMLGAAKDSFADDWPKVQEYAKPEVKKLAQSLADITKLVVNETINQQQAQALLQIHKNTTLMVLLTIEGLGVIAVENAMNAAIKTVEETINAAAGIKLL
jgi:hypothetical protein